MREIKFRAWDDNKRAIVRARLIQNESLKVVDERGFDLMQYTGLKDKNKKELFDGDIVFAWFSDEDHDKRKCLVKWGGYYPAFDLYEKSKRAASGYEPFSDEYNSLSNDDIIFEIIGNIHENPELLE